jgi:hypothetical protein
VDIGQTHIKLDSIQEGKPLSVDVPLLKDKTIILCRVEILVSGLQDFYNHLQNLHPS